MGWKDIGGLVIGAILGIAATFFLFQGRVSTLETRIQYLMTPQFAPMTEAAQQVSTAVAATLTAAPTSTPAPTPTAPDAAATSTAQAGAAATSVAATLAAVPTATPPPTPAPDAVVSLNGAALWAQPSMSSVFEAVYVSGAPMKIIGKLPDDRVLLVMAPDGRIGWTLADYLRLNTALGSVRVLCAEPTATATATPTP
jgi:hypothetical protein